VRELVERLELPYACLATLYEGSSEVRRYRNTVTGADQVGKRIDLLGLDDTVVVHEARVLRSIEHRNIVPVLDVASVQDPAYPPPMQVVEMLMPFYPRGSLVDAFERGERFSIGEACALVGAALLGLGELHEVHGILHRDVKSPNLLLAKDASLVKLGDLGVSVWMDEFGGAEAFRAAHPYVPPETYTSGRVERSGDLYGMGLVLMEMASEPLPYDNYTVDGLASRLERGWRGPGGKDLRLMPHVPRGLRAIIRKATAVQPADRYQSAAAMGAAITRLRYVDWSPCIVEGDQHIWEGQSNSALRRRYRVASAIRRGRRCLSAYQLTSTWRRMPGIPDIIVADLYDTAAATFFDTIVERATSN
jgi:serine/threonine protein kinase